MMRWMHLAADTLVVGILYCCLDGRSRRKTIVSKIDPRAPELGWPAQQLTNPGGGGLFSEM